MQAFKWYYDSQLSYADLFQEHLREKFLFQENQHYNVIFFLTCPLSSCLKSLSQFLNTISAFSVVNHVYSTWTKHEVVKLKTMKTHKQLMFR